LIMTKLLRAGAFVAVLGASLSVIGANHSQAATTISLDTFAPRTVATADRHSDIRQETLLRAGLAELIDGTWRSAITANVDVGVRQVDIRQETLMGRDVAVYRAPLTMI
jgi:hypothetical protein